MSKPEAVLAIKSLTKKYRQLVAVNEIDLEIFPGDFVGFIGPNGAGKSSTMGTIAGIIAPDQGSVQINGIDVVSDPVNARLHLGFVPQHLTLLDYLTGLEYLHFVAELRSLNATERDAEIDELLSLTELNDARNTVLKEYSGGMLRKLALSAALLGAPALLVLDESFVGLDPESTYRLRKRLQRHCNDGGAIMLSSHILDMLEPICTRFVFLHHGQIVEDLSKESFRARKQTGEFEDLTELYLSITGKGDSLQITDPKT